jgi:hypothetical protein
VRLETTVSGAADVSVSSYLHEANKTLTVVVINGSSSARTVTVNVPAAPLTLRSFQAHTSSNGNGNLWKSSTVAVASGKATVAVPAYGVVTLFGIDGPMVTSTKAQSQSGIEVYPNPTKGELNVSLPDAKAGEVSIVFANALGAKVLKETRVLGANKQLALSVSKLPEGFYSITVTQGNKQFVKSVIVAR